MARAVEVEVTSQGASVDESLANLREALELYFEDQPLPMTATDGPIVAALDIRLPGVTACPAPGLRGEEAGIEAEELRTLLT